MEEIVTKPAGSATLGTGLVNCEQIGKSGAMELYLAGKLSATELEIFEQHYYSCARCSEELRVLRATRAALLAAGLPSEPVPHIRRGAIWAIALVAAAIFFAFVLARTISPPR
ncbi:MAG: hypothetical protein ABI759_09885 [Candidatus Solibacter sp.]